MSMVASLPAASSVASPVEPGIPPLWRMVEEIGIWQPAASIVCAACANIPYAQESAWREDARRVYNGAQVRRVTQLAISSKAEVDFSGYYQRHVKAAQRSPDQKFKAVYNEHPAIRTGDKRQRYHDDDDASNKNVSRTRFEEGVPRVLRVLHFPLPVLRFTT